MPVPRETHEQRLYRTKRTDGKCPRCGVRARQVAKSGRVKEYCKECRAAYKREYRQNQRMLRGGMDR